MHLSSLLGLWESAVDLALNISTELAKQIANMPPQSELELRKKLWLKIGTILKTTIAFNVHHFFDFCVVRPPPFPNCYLLFYALQ